MLSSRCLLSRVVLRATTFRDETKMRSLKPTLAMGTMLSALAQSAFVSSGGHCGRLRRVSFSTKSLDSSSNDSETEVADASSSSSFATDYHAPVMCQECVDSLLSCSKNTNESLIFVDGTLGGGGHSAAILSRLGPGDVLFGCDVDPAALETASARLSQYMNPLTLERHPLFVPVQSNFCDLHTVIPTLLHPVTQEPILAQNVGVDGILLDLGVSSHQIDTPERGFAFMQDGPLDMRMSTSGGLSAADICNQFDETELRRILKVFGDEPRASKIAHSIVQHRPLATTNDLVEAVAAVTPARAKSRRMGRTASLARVFQSLRIVVNQEDVVLEKALTEMCPSLVRPGGRMVILAYHSMEDRYAKRVIRDGTVERRGTMDEKDVYGNYIGTPKPWKRVGKPQKATEQEVESNPRARSATLRVGERQDTS